MNLIYMCVFHQEQYIELLHMLIRSIYIKANVNHENTEILIITSPEFYPIIQEKLSRYFLPIHYYLLKLYTIFDAGCARLHIFNYTNINLYDKILYLDTDILVNSDINVLFHLDISPDKLYTLEEHTIGDEIMGECWGSQFFDFSKFDRKTTAFTSGILYFCNSLCIHELFKDILSHIIEYTSVSSNAIPVCLDQPFIVYNAITQNKYDNQLMKKYFENNPETVSNEKIIYHFPGGVGNYGSKYNKMSFFWHKMNQKVKICQYGTDGFGHQFEGLLRMISLDLNDKAEYMYSFRTSYTFEHINVNTSLLNEYLHYALRILSNNKLLSDSNFQVIYHENRTFENIIIEDKDYQDNIYFYDGVGTGSYLPSNFEVNTDLEKSLPKLRNAFVETNPILPAPSYDQTFMTVVCHIRQGDAIGTRCLDNDSLINMIHYLQQNTSYRIIIHSDGNIDHLQSENTILKDKNTDVLQILSDFIHADILIMNYSALSIAAHLLAKPSQKVICPNMAGPTFFHRILPKCKTVNKYMCKIMGKSYHWNNALITFVENGIVNSYTIGNYIQVESHQFQMNIDGEDYMLKFNESYSIFISTNVKDNETKTGGIIS